LVPTPGSIGFEAGQRIQNTEINLEGGLDAFVENAEQNSSIEIP